MSDEKKEIAALVKRFLRASEGHPPPVVLAASVDFLVAVIEAGVKSNYRQSAVERIYDRMRNRLHLLKDETSH
jgi:hypothetical protein